MNKLYLVFSLQDNRDTSVAQDTPRLITANPIDALGQARKIMSNNDEDHWVSRVLIFALDLDRNYTIKDFSLRADENLPDQPLVFIGHWVSGRPTERLFASFEVDSAGCMVPPAEAIAAGA